MYKIPGKQIVLNTDSSLANASDIVISSQLAIKTYVDAQIGSAVSRYVATIDGDNTTTTFDIVHNFNSYDVFIQIFSASADRENISPVISRIDLNTARIAFAIAPVIDEAFRVIII